MLYQINCVCYKLYFCLAELKIDLFIHIFLQNALKEHQFANMQYTSFGCINVFVKYSTTSATTLFLKRNRFEADIFSKLITWDVVSRASWLSIGGSLTRNGIRERRESTQMKMRTIQLTVGDAGVLLMKLRQDND